MGFYEPIVYGRKDYDDAIKYIQANFEKFWSEFMKFCHPNLKKDEKALKEMLYEYCMNQAERAIGEFDDELGLTNEIESTYLQQIMLDIFHIGYLVLYSLSGNIKALDKEIHRRKEANKNKNILKPGDEAYGLYLRIADRSIKYTISVYKAAEVVGNEEGIDDIEALRSKVYFFLKHHPEIPRNRSHRRNNKTSNI